MSQTPNRPRQHLEALIRVWAEDIDLSKGSHREPLYLDAGEMDVLASHLAARLIGFLASAEDKQFVCDAFNGAFRKTGKAWYVEGREIDYVHCHASVRNTFPSAEAYLRYIFPCR